jgi:hypothetical protein
MVNNSYGSRRIKYECGRGWHKAAVFRQWCTTESIPRILHNLLIGFLRGP